MNSRLSFTNILMIDVNILTQFRPLHNPIKTPDRVKSRSMLLISYNLDGSFGIYPITQHFYRRHLIGNV